MEKRKCPKCNLVNWYSSSKCQRCDYSLSEGDSPARFNTLPSEAQTNSLLSSEKQSPQEIKTAGWKKIKWGGIISIIGFTTTFAFFASGLQTRRVGFFAIITLIPIAALLAGIFEASQVFQFLTLLINGKSYHRGKVG